MSHLESIVPPLFKKTLGQWASGVTVITTLREGNPHGMTAVRSALFRWNLPWSWFQWISELDYISYCLKRVDMESAFSLKAKTLFRALGWTPWQRLTNSLDRQRACRLLMVHWPILLAMYLTLFLAGITSSISGL